MANPGVETKTASAWEAEWVLVEARTGVEPI